MERRKLMLSGLGMLGAATVAQAARKDKKGGKKAVKVVDPATDPKLIAEIRATLDAHDKAFTDQDLEGVMATYQPGPYTIVVGTGPGEMWAGKEEIEDAYKHFFTDFDKGTQSFDYHYVNGQIHGDAAWMSATGEVSARKGQKELKVGMNISGVLVKDGDKWKISLFHYSSLAGQNK